VGRVASQLPAYGAGVSLQQASDLDLRNSAHPMGSDNDLVRRIASPKNVTRG
jgi:hypothetical protein